jgi:hypothetical protein
MYNLNYTQLPGYKIEEKLYLGVREQKKVDTTRWRNSLLTNYNRTKRLIELITTAYCGQLINKFPRMNLTARRET